MLICGLLPHHQPPDWSASGYRYVHFGSQLLFAMAVINLAGSLLFRVLLPLVRLQPPPILRDTILGLAYIAAALTLLARHGVDLSGIVATSAVVTAVIGFSLQDTLGNIMGGMALQMEQSIAVGDWVRVGEVEGLVREIRWRQTSIETRNWDTVVVPNSSLMKSQVKVLGRRQGKPRLHRMWVEFNIDFRHPPAHVIETVQNALRAESTPNVAADPPPDCILYHFYESYVRYAVRYWLIDFASDDGTNSEMSLRIVAALERAGIGMSIPAQRVFLTMQGETRTRRKHLEEVRRRTAALEHVTLLKPLTDAERAEIAERVLVAPFHRGEIILRQGSEAHYLYILAVGSVEISVTEEGQSRVITRIDAGEAFGEMGLMTGEPRNATATAVTEVVCYRLDKAGFQDILQRRPEIAETLAGTLAERKAHLEALKRGLHAQALEHTLGGSQADLLHRIRDFFMLSG
jgi:small-conductance mechanosensitive channel